MKQKQKISSTTPRTLSAQEVMQLAQNGKKAALTIAHASSTAKNQALASMVQSLSNHEEAILAANQKDIAGAQEKGLSEAMIDRLLLTPDRLQKMVTAVEQAIKLPDPVGRNLRSWTNEAGLLIEKVAVPLGLIAIIYESRPNVTSDAAILCLKAGNAAILRGGSEAFHSNMAIAAALQEGLEVADFPREAIQLLPSTDRALIPLLCQQKETISCIIPRGGKGLIETVTQHALMPVIKHDDGICIAYIDEEADLNMTEKLLLNAKCQRPGVCNAIETVLLNTTNAAKVLATSGKALLEAGVQLRCDRNTLDAFPVALREKYTSQIQEATPQDFDTEFLALTLAIKTVNSLEEALQHIEEHSSHHSEMIVTENEAHAQKFLKEVDSAAVYWNASTRFTDGGAFGFGAEIGISTDKLHARGPMGLEELTSYNYRIQGKGTIRQ